MKTVQFNRDFVSSEYYINLNLYKRTYIKFRELENLRDDFIFPTHFFQGIWIQQNR